MNKKFVGIIVIILLLFGVAIYLGLEKFFTKTIQDDSFYANTVSNGNIENFQASQSLSEIEKEVRARAQAVVLALRDKDMESLVSFVHPEKGVRFSPYTYVNKDTDVVFDIDHLRNSFTDSTKYIWGVYDGTGKPIRLSFVEYYEQFIYDQDFVNADKVGYNEIIGNGNTINNIFEAYPDAEVVEYYFSGSDPKYSGMDWSSLRLVFEEDNGVWYLVGIIHDQWTI